MSKTPRTKSTEPSWRKGLAAAGLRTRYRDLLGAAYVSSMSNGLLSRRLGRGGWLLLPISGPLHLIVVCATRSSTVRRRGACCQILPPTGAMRPDPIALAAFVVCVVTYSIALAAVALVLPAAWVTPMLLLLVVVLLVDTAAGVCCGVIRQRRHDVPKLKSTAVELDAVQVVGVAAYPRGQGHGSELLRAVHAVLDEVAMTAVLDARPQREDLDQSRMPRWSRSRAVERDLTDYYDGLGYRAAEVWRRMVRHPGVNGPSATTPQ